VSFNRHHKALGLRLGVTTSWKYQISNTTKSQNNKKCQNSNVKIISNIKKTNLEFRILDFLGILDFEFSWGLVVLGFGIYLGFGTYW
jgi:hypothetical protein